VARSRLIVDDPSRVADWCAARIEHFSGWGSDPKAIGLEVNGKLSAGVVYTNYTPANVFASIVIDGGMNPNFLYAIFFNPFEQWKVRHISCAIEGSNERSLKLCSNMGFIEEGRMRESAINGEDVILMGMLKSECRFL
jgi:RimJ/RimL family protein N-acetyltransferase